MDGFYVYCLFRPNGLPFYIGKGKGNRWAEHGKPSQHDGGYKSNIIRRAKQDGLEIPRTILRSGLSEADAFVFEQAFIAALGRYPNGLLANRTDGGEGISGHRHSIETRAVMATHKRGKPSLRRGIPASPETIAKISAALKGRVSPKKGKAMSMEQRQKLSLAHTGKKLSEEHRAKIQAAGLRNPPNKGRTFGPETRARMRASRLRFLENMASGLN